MNWEGLMRRALALAQRGQPHPNPYVGALVVSKGEILGHGWHNGPGTAHAEVAALRDAGESAIGATLIVTLEPCNHVGRTPPCVDAILSSKIARVVYAAGDPNPRVVGGGATRLREAGCEVIPGVLEKVALEQNRAWNKWIRTGLPYVVLKLALTSDNSLTGVDRWITGPIARARVHRLRRFSDAILVGKGTVEADNPALTNRSGLGRDPLRVVLDTRLELGEEFQILSEESRKGTVVCFDKALGKHPPGEGLQVSTDRSGRLRIEEILQALGKRGVCQVLSEGGARVAESLLRDGFVDEIEIHRSCYASGKGEAAFLKLIEEHFEVHWTRRIGGDNVLLARPKGICFPG